MKTKDVIKLIEKAIAREREYVSTCLTSDQRNNPQVVVERLKAEGAIDSLGAVFSALKFGDSSELRTKAGM